MPDSAESCRAPSIETRLSFEARRSQVSLFLNYHNGNIFGYFGFGKADSENAVSILRAYRIPFYIHRKNNGTGKFPPVTFLIKIMGRLGDGSVALSTNCQK